MFVLVEIIYILMESIFVSIEIIFANMEIIFVSIKISFVIMIKSLVKGRPQRRLSRMQLQPLCRTTAWGSK